MTRNSFTRSAIALTLGLAAHAAMAQYTVQVGGAYLDPHSSASAVSGPMTPSNALSLTVKPQSTVFFSAARDLDEHWDLQLSLGIPPVHDTALKVIDASALPASVAAQDGVIISRARQVAPTLFANYKFGDPGSTWRPFVGLGINYTSFDQTESTAANNLVNGGPTRIKLSDSWGAAAQVGVIYQIDSQWSLVGTYSTADVKTTVTTNTLGIERRADVKFNPSVLIFALGYHF